MEAHISPSLISGRIKAPQSKSIAIRLLFASLLGDISLVNLEGSEDVQAAINAISSVKNAMGIEGSPSGALNVRGSGTTLRMLLPILGFLGMECTLSGDQTLEKRPLGVIKSWLEDNGAALSSDHLPLRISGKITTDNVEISGSESSQYISGLIYGLLLAGGGKINLIPPVRSRSYIEMTCSVLNSLGCSVNFKGLEIKVQPPGSRLRFRGVVPGDFLLSSFYAIGAIITGGELDITGLNYPGWSSGDSRIVGIIHSSGKDSYMYDESWHIGGKEGVNPFEENVEDSPDMAVSLAALAAVAIGESRITGTQLLGIKESNRNVSITRTLESFGIEASAGDEISIRNTGIYHEGIVKDWKDHRIAMLGTILALRSGGIIHGAESVAKSNPHFYDDIIRLGGKLTLRF